MASTQHTTTTENIADIEVNKPSKARFLFLLGFFGFFIFFSSCLFGIYKNKYKSTKDIEVPENTLYTPKYK